ncbi:hypothetical protein Tco_1221757, partial [Tanacetum coccineum]
MKENTSLVTRAAKIDLDQKQIKLLSAQQRSEEADRCVILEDCQGHAYTPVKDGLSFVYIAALKILGISLYLHHPFDMLVKDHKIMYVPLLKVIRSERSSNGLNMAPKLSFTVVADSTPIVI